MSAFGGKRLILFIMNEADIKNAIANKAVFYSDLLEFIVPVGTTFKIQIQDQQLLQGARITDLEVFSSNDISVSPLGNRVIGIADLITGYFNAYASDPTVPFIPNANNNNNAGLWLSPVPLVDMHKVQTGTDPFVRDGFRLAGNSTVFWGKSDFAFPDGLVTADTPQSLLMRVSYLLYPGNTTN